MSEVVNGTFPGAYRFIKARKTSEQNYLGQKMRYFDSAWISDKATLKLIEDNGEIVSGTFEFIVDGESAGSYEILKCSNDYYALRKLCLFCFKNHVSHQFFQKSTSVKGKKL